MRHAPLALLLILAAPSAAACDYIVRDGFSRVPWADDEAAFTDQAGEYGTYWWGNGTFQPRVDPFDLMSPRVSPDGAWVVWQEARGTSADCAPLDGRLLAQRLDRGASFVLHEGSVRAIDVGATHAAYVPLGARSVTLAPLATREAARSFEIPDDHVFLLRMSADARHLALWHPLAERVIVLDTTTSARVVDAERERGEHVHQIAFAPDGAHLALLETAQDGNATLRILSLRDGSLVAERVFGGETGIDLAWNGLGLAVATYTAHRPGDGTIAIDSTLRAFPEAPNVSMANELPRPGEQLEALALTPSGVAVVAAGGELRRVTLDWEVRPRHATTPTSGPTPSSGAPPTSGGAPTGRPAQENDVPLGAPLVALGLALAAIAARSSGRRR